MRTLTIDNNWEDWKFGDTDAVMTFTALDDDQTPDFTGKTLTFKIADTTASMPEIPHDYVASTAGHVEDNKVVLKTEDVKTLTPGTYSVELWALDNSTQKNAVYPSKGFAFFTIEENTMKVSDITNVPSKTLEAIWAELVQRVGALKQGEQGEPGQTPKLVIGTVTEVGSDQQPSVSLTPTANDPNTYTVNFQIPIGAKGDKGDPGVPGTPGVPGLPGKDGLTPQIDAQTGHWKLGNLDTGVVAEGATIKIGTVTTGTPDEEAAVTNSGDSHDAVLNIVIPKGDPGLPGKDADLTDVKKQLQDLQNSVKALQDASTTPTSANPATSASTVSGTTASAVSAPNEIVVDQGSHSGTIHAK